MGRSSEWVTAATVTVALAVVSVSTAISFYICRKKAKVLKMKIEELESSIDCCLKKCAAERQGRVRAQQALREALAAQTKSGNLEETSYYPMTPIGFVHSCFSTRNGTPRQPLLVPLARAHLIFNRAQVPPASLEGLAGYSHCWILYVFHLNTDLEKLWKKPTRSKFKAKVRVPRLKGERIGVFATRSPHRPCPIGLTVAKVEAVQGNTVLLSGVDLVDGTPVLDIKPYLPYCDSIQEATVPKWVTDDNLLAVASVSFSEGFSSSLAECWENVGKNSLYASPDELKCLIKQILLWDIRSVSQRNQPHDPTKGNDNASNGSPDPDGKLDEDIHAENVIYHLILEGVDISYEIDNDGNVVVEKATISSK